MRHYSELWLLLAISFVFFFVLSIFDGIAINDSFELRPAGFAEAVFPKQPEADAPAAPAVEAVRAAAGPAPTDTTSQTILFIGDSMLDGLSPRMAEYCLQNGHRLVSVRWYSSSTLKWGKSARLRELIAAYRPTYIFICLGANELSIAKVEEKRGPDIDRILREVGETPYRPQDGSRQLLSQRRHEFREAQRRRSPDERVGGAVARLGDALDARPRRTPHTHEPPRQASPSQKAIADYRQTHPA